MSQKRLCLLVEDQPPNQIRMSAALAEAFGEVELHITATVKAARQWLKALEPASAERFSLAVIDLGLPDGSGTEIITTIAAQFPDVTCVVSSVYDDDVHLFDALAAGARGYLVKNHEPEMMVYYLRRIDAGEPPLSPSVAIRLMRHFRDIKAPARDEIALTGRETETLALIARGFTVAEVAGHLLLSPTTVAGYVRVIYQKLNISTRAEATLEAVRRGLA